MRIALAVLLAASVAEVRPPTQSLSWQSDGCAGESLAIVSGCPQLQAAPFVIRLRMARGLAVPSHSHPVDENITVLRGELTIRMQRDGATTVARLRQGDFFTIPAYVPHFADAVQETEIQTNGIGPLVTTWTAARCAPSKEPAKPVACAR